MCKKLLLIDDDTNEQFFFNEALKEINAPVKFYFANGAKEGIRILNSLLPDCVFIDLNMPAINGLNALNQLQILSAIRAPG